MKVRRILLTGAALLLATALTVSAQGAIDPAEQARRFPTVPTPTTLYFHINGFQEFPINTQAPDDRFRETVTVGTLTNSNGCVKDPSGSAGVASQEFHTFYGYVSPSYVQYDVIENGKPRIHQERGIAYDVQLGGDFTLKWYVETQALSGDPTPDINGLPVPMVLPDVMVRASMRAGDVISIQNKAYNDGPLIAQGVSGPFTLAGAMTGSLPATGTPEGSVAYTTLPNGHHLYEFTVPMKLSQNVIPREDGANMRIDVYMRNDACSNPDNGYLMPNVVRIHTSPEHRPRMDLVVNNPIMIPYLHPQFVAEDLVIHTQLNSPWGNYDVDEGPGGIEVKVDGPTPARNVDRASFVQHALDHNKHQDAVDVTYVWDYLAEGAADGVYTVTVKVRNDQGNAEAVGTSKFQIGKGNSGMPACKENIPLADQPPCIIVRSEPKQESPGAGILVGLLLLALAFVVRRRGA